MIRPADALEHCRAVLMAGGYDVDFSEEEGLGPVLLAETLYALVMAVVVPEDGTERFVEEAQATLTRYAAAHPSPRSWDLYLVLVVPGDNQSYDAVRDAVESDTRYARKLVVTGDRATTERILRLLLPLRPVAQIELTEPLGAMRAMLVGAHIEVTLADAALSSFAETGEVHIP
jgi:hypothetical protein